MNSKFFLLIALIIYILLTYNFSSTLCIFSNTTGIPCPGCGLTRAYLCFFRGDLAGAFYFHPLFLLLAIVAMILIFNKLKINKFTIKNGTAIVFLVVTLAVYVVRMALLFPNHEPMNINYYGIIPRFLKLINII